MPGFKHETSLPFRPQELYDYHLRPGAFHRLTPPWESVRVLEPDHGIHPGCERTLLIGPGPLAFRWVAAHENFVEGRQFCDRQQSGPFRSWVHTHAFLDAPEGSLLQDRIEYSLPLGLPLGWLFRGMLRRTFRYRHRQTLRDLTRITSYPGPASPKGGRPLKVAITGSSGLVGSHLSSFLGVAGHQVVPLERGLESSDEGVLWWPEPDLESLEGLDAVVHLAGEPVAQLWTPSVREKLYFSRVEGTQRLCEALAQLKNPPQTVICASAIGYYDQNQPGPIDEGGEPGSDLLARICHDWEAATRAAEDRGIRVCHLRVGLVVSAAGGYLKAQLPAFKMGAGAVLGDGQQVQNVIDIDDLVGAIYHLLQRSDLSGPFNGTGPEPVTQARFATLLASCLGRPLLLRAPGAPLRMLLRDQASMLLDGVTVQPKRLLDSGFTFQATTVQESLSHQLGLAGFKVS